MPVHPVPLCAALFLAQPALGCETALLLAMDVSGSVDLGEYQIQREGLAAALRSPEIVDILINDQVAMSVMQWSAATQQAVVIDWVKITSATEVEALAQQVATMPRAFSGADTGIGHALRAAAQHFKSAPSCARYVLDVSGDGDENSGFILPQSRREVIEMDVQINGLAIESIGRSITSYYEQKLVSGSGFVETAQGYLDFPRAIHRKLLRELSPPSS